MKWYRNHVAPSRDCRELCRRLATSYHELSTRSFLSVPEKANCMPMSHAVDPVQLEFWIAQSVLFRHTKGLPVHDSHPNFFQNKFCRIPFWNSRTCDGMTVQRDYIYSLWLIIIQEEDEYLPWLSWWQCDCYLQRKLGEIELRTFVQQTPLRNVQTCSRERERERSQRMTKVKLKTKEQMFNLLGWKWCCWWWAVKPHRPLAWKVRAQHLWQAATARDENRREKAECRWRRSRSLKKMQGRKWNHRTSELVHLCKDQRQDSCPQHRPESSASLLSKTASTTPYSSRMMLDRSLSTKHSKIYAQLDLDLP